MPGLSRNAQEHFSELVPFHEVAHQWWGNVVGWSSYRDQWIDEAMANYLALLFADTRKNPDHTLHVWLQRYRQKLIEKSPNADEPADEIGALALGMRLNSSKSPNAYEDVIYPKGAWVIHMLREMLRQPGPNPDARFNALLHTLVTKYAYRALKHSGFAARSGSGDDSLHGSRRRPFHGMVFRSNGCKAPASPTTAWNSPLTKPTTAYIHQRKTIPDQRAAILHRPSPAYTPPAPATTPSFSAQSSPPAPKPHSTSPQQPPRANSSSTPK